MSKSMSKNTSKKMPSSRRTNLLIVLVAISAICCILAWRRLAAKRDTAVARADDLAVSRQYLADLTTLRDSPRHVATAPPNRAQLHQKIRAAADAAGAGERLMSVEPAQPVQLENSDYAELPVTLQFDPMPLRDLAAFLGDLSSNDPGSRASQIRLSTPQSSAPADTWRADVTLSYLIYSPRPQPRDP